MLTFIKQHGGRDKTGRKYAFMLAVGFSGLFNY